MIYPHLQKKTDSSHFEPEKWSPSGWTDFAVTATLHSDPRVYRLSLQFWVGFNFTYYYMGIHRLHMTNTLQLSPSLVELSHWCHCGVTCFVKLFCPSFTNPGDPRLSLEHFAAGTAPFQWPAFADPDGSRMHQVYGWSLGWKISCNNHVISHPLSPPKTMNKSSLF